LVIFVIFTNSVFAQNVVLRSRQFFGGDGITLQLNANGTMILSITNDIKNGDWAVSSGRYTISGNTIRLISDSGNTLATCPFQWEQQGSTIKWIEISGVRITRR
jgi:hypothetical protein